MKTSWLTIFALAGSVGCAAELDTGETEQEVQQGRDPVVFVHGCYPGPPLAPPPYENASSAFFFGPMSNFFLERGYSQEDVHVFVYSGAVCGSNIDMAVELADVVDDVLARTCASKVDLVTHSMGALTTRLYLNQGGDQHVRDVAIIAGSNHGTAVAQLGPQWQALLGAPAYEGALEMFPPYACDGDSLGADVQAAVNGCLTPSGRAVFKDETPSGIEDGGHIAYLNLYLTNDEINFPRESACLNQDFINDCSDGVNVALTDVEPAGQLPAHVTVLQDPDVMQRVYQFVAGAGRRY